MNDGLADAGITDDDVVSLNCENRVCCFVGNFIAENYINQGHLGALLTIANPAFYGVPSARYEAACASSSVAIDEAISRLRLGDYDLAIVVGFELMKTVDSRTGGDFLGRAAYYEQEGKDVQFPFPSLFGKLANETVKKYGLDNERYMNALAKISVTNYDNAKRNPMAQTRNWFMDFDQANNRGTETNAYIGGQLSVSDCSQVTDGAAVVVLASKRYVDEHSRFEGTPIVKGFGHRNAPMLFSDKLKDSSNSKYILPWTKMAVDDCYRRAGLSVQDIDCFETHDCFTSSEYAALSCFGLSSPGREYEAVESGLISFDGDKPVNPSGGLIGCGHPVGASGARMFLDIYKQVAGKAGSYQVDKVNNAMMLNFGGTATTNYAFILGNNG